MKKRVRKLWNFDREGYPPGIDAEWAKRENSRIRTEIMKGFGLKRRKPRKRLK